MTACHLFWIFWSIRINYFENIRLYFCCNPKFTSTLATTRLILHTESVGPTWCRAMHCKRSATSTVNYDYGESLNKLLLYHTMQTVSCNEEKAKKTSMRICYHSRRTMKRLNSTAIREKPRNCGTKAANDPAKFRPTCLFDFYTCYRPILHRLATKNNATESRQTEQWEKAAFAIASAA